MFNTWFILTETQDTLAVLLNVPLVCLGLNGNGKVTMFVAFNLSIKSLKPYMVRSIMW